MHLKKLILIILNSLILFVVIVLSITFYNQFSNVLNNRILLQLNSIKTLKQLQLENLINNEWNTFLKEDLQNATSNTINLKLPDSIKYVSGIYDFTSFNNRGDTSIGLVRVSGGTSHIKIIAYHKIKSILLERTGMGNSGESYLVGKDYKMRSQSRFFKNKKPFLITVKTKGVLDALAGSNGKGVFKDYRGIDVFSVYSLIKIQNLKLVILSEIDVDEVTIPLKNLRIRLFGLTVVILIIAIILSLFLTNIITDPISNMQKSLKIMAGGNYNENVTYSKNSIEIKEMFDALNNLKASLQGAVKFSSEIGKMNLNTAFTTRSENDALGKSLITMRNKLLEFRTKEQQNSMNTKRLLVDGLENERRRLSRELHDGIGPLLTTLKFYIDNQIEDKKKRLDMKTIVDDTVTEIRFMSYALMPSSIDDFGVGATLTNFVENIKKTLPINIKYEDLTKHEHSKITNNQAINLFRICQELINNSIKHSSAENIRITLSEFDDFISLFYFDDGTGFDLQGVKLGSGIINIKERIKICNGNVVINSKKGNTSFEIELPIHYD